MTTENKNVFDRFDAWWASRIQPKLSRFGLAGAVFAFTVTLLIWAGQVLGLDASEWASWVQAVGSVAAILVAVQVSSEQFRRQEQRDKLTRMELAQHQFETTCALVFNLKRFCELYGDETLSEKGFQVAIEALRDRMRPLLTAPIWEFADSTMSQHFMQFCGDCEHYIAVALHAKDGRKVFEIVGQECNKFLTLIGFEDS